MRLGRILLDPAARGRGSGRELISTAVRTGSEITELPAMKLGVSAHNVSARRVYENLGFQETGRMRSTEVNGHPWHAGEPAEAVAEADFHRGWYTRLSSPGGMGAEIERRLAKPRSRRAIADLGGEA